MWLYIYTVHGGLSLFFWNSEREKKTRGLFFLSFSLRPHFLFFFFFQRLATRNDRFVPSSFILSVLRYLMMAILRFFFSFLTSNATHFFWVVSLSKNSPIRLRVCMWAVYFEPCWKI
jgi:phosphoglycerol transferase MdoB-like AlkP superfamily enzyme